MNFHTEKSMYAPGETAEFLIEQLPPEAVRLRATLRHLEKNRADGGSSCGGVVRSAAAGNGLYRLSDAGAGAEFKRRRAGRGVWGCGCFVQLDEISALRLCMGLYACGGCGRQNRRDEPLSSQRRAVLRLAVPASSARSERIYPPGKTGRAEPSPATRCGPISDAAHEKNMACMAYNMIYAANSDLPDGRLRGESAMAAGQGERAGFYLRYGREARPGGRAAIFQPAERGTGKSISLRRKRKCSRRLLSTAGTAMTIGENGPMRTADGEPLGYDENGAPIELVKNCYTQFLNAAKAAIAPRYLAFQSGWRAGD